MQQRAAPPWRATPRRAPGRSVRQRRGAPAQRAPGAARALAASGAAAAALPTCPRRGRMPAALRAGQREERCAVAAPGVAPSVACRARRPGLQRTTPLGRLPRPRQQARGLQSAPASAPRPSVFGRARRQCGSSGRRASLALKSAPRLGTLLPRGPRAGRPATRALLGRRWVQRGVQSAAPGLPPRPSSMLRRLSRSPWRRWRPREGPSAVLRGPADPRRPRSSAPSVAARARHLCGHTTGTRSPTPTGRPPGGACAQGRANGSAQGRAWAQARRSGTGGRRGGRGRRRGRCGRR